MLDLNVGNTRTARSEGVENPEGGVVLACKNSVGQTSMLKAFRRRKRLMKNNVDEEKAVRRKGT